MAVMKEFFRLLQNQQQIHKVTAQLIYKLVLQVLNENRPLNMK